MGRVRRRGHRCRAVSAHLGGGSQRRIKSPAPRSFPSLFQRLPRLATPVIREIECSPAVASATEGGSECWQDVGRPRCWSTLRSTESRRASAPHGDCPNLEQGGLPREPIQVQRAKSPVRKRMAQHASAAVGRNATGCPRSALTSWSWRPWKDAQPFTRTRRIDRPDLRATAALARDRTRD